MFGREPAVILGLVSAAIALAVGFGLDVTPEQVGLIMAAVTAIIGFVTRSQVTPTASTPRRNESGAVSLAFVLFLAALVCFLLALFHVKPGDVSLVVLGFVFVAGGLLAGYVPARP